MPPMKGTPAPPPHNISSRNTTVPGGFRSLGYVAHNEYQSLLNRASPQRFRLLSCDDFLGSSRSPDVQIFEGPAPKSILHPNSAIGSLAYAVCSTASMGFKEPEPYKLPIWLLKLVCHAAKARNVHYLWFDKACVRPAATDEGDDDWRWHATHMGDIYSLAKLCIVVPTHTLTAGPDLLDLNTASVPPHVHSGWSLLEMCCAEEPTDLCEKAVVLHRWDHGPGRWEVALDGALGEYQRKGIGGPAETLTVLTIDGTSRYALSPLPYLLDGALNRLQFEPKAEGSPVQMFDPQLLGATKRRTSPSTAPYGARPASDHKCDDCIGLLLDIMKTRFEYHTAEDLERAAANSQQTTDCSKDSTAVLSNPAGAARERFVEALLLGAFTRYYSNQEDIVHILRYLLRPRHNQTMKTTIQAAQITPHDVESSMAQILWRLMPPPDACRPHVDVYWIRFLAPLYGQSLNPDIPLFAGVLTPAAWSEKELRNASRDGTLPAPPRPSPHFLFRTRCTVSRTIYPTNPRVQFEARVSHTLQGWAVAKADILFLYVGEWLASSDAKAPKSVLIMTLKKAHQDGERQPIFAHTGWQEKPWHEVEERFPEVNERKKIYVTLRAHNTTEDDSELSRGAALMNLYRDNY